MSVSLMDANGRNVSAFGTGNSMFSQGTGVNPGTFSGQQSSLFGATLNRGTPSTTPAPISTTAAGSTSNLGFTDARKTPAVRSAKGSGGQLNPVAPSAAMAPASLTATNIKSDAMPLDPAAKAVSKSWGPQEQQTVPTPPSSPSATGRQIATGLYSMGQAAASRIKAFGSGATEARDGTAPGGLFSASGVADDLAEDVA